MTDPLDTLRALEAAATPGPWRATTIGHHSIYDAAQRAAQSIMQGTTTDLSWVDTTDEEPHVALTANGPKATDNAALIAAARNALPALLAIAKALPEDPWEEVSELDSDQRHICRWCGGRKPQHNDDCRWSAASAALATLQEVMP